MSTLGKDPMIQQARFNIGEIVCHQKHGYHAVIIDVDPNFQPTGYKKQKLPKNHPSNSSEWAWYRLLVDGSSHTTYVEENMLDKVNKTTCIENPNIKHYLESHSHGYSLPDQQLN